MARFAPDPRLTSLVTALGVGMSVGCLGVILRLSLHSTLVLRVAWASQYPLLWIVLTTVACGLAVQLTQTWAPEAAGSSFPTLSAAVHDRKPMRWRRVLPVTLGGAWLAISSGLLVGPEAPMVLVGAALGQGLSRPAERVTLIAAGAGAGLAAVFSAPLAGILFVFEELGFGFTPALLTSTFTATVTATVVVQLALGQQPAFPTGPWSATPLIQLPVIALLGAGIGMLGVGCNAVLLGVLTQVQRWPVRPAGLRGILLGAGIGVVAWGLPWAAGEGDRITTHLLTADLPLGESLFLLPLRMLLMALSYGCGVPGGLYAPLLALGAEAGRVGSQLLSLGSLLPAASPQTLTVIGMAALFTAVKRAPVLGIVMVMEITGSYTLLVELALGSLCAYLTAHALGNHPVHERVQHQDRHRHRDEATT